MRGTACRADAIVLDHGEPTAAARLCAELDARGIIVDALVNNAGYGVPGLYANVPWDAQEPMLQVMVVGLCDLTRRLWPGMLERGYGRVINVASLAGLVPAPAGHTLYGATKAFLIKFSEALAHEGRAHGVHVTALCPGFTLSEFHDVTGTRDQMNRLPRWLWMDAPTVARMGFDAVDARPGDMCDRSHQPHHRAAGAPDAAGDRRGRGHADGAELQKDVNAASPRHAFQSLLPALRAGGSASPRGGHRPGVGRSLVLCPAAVTDRPPVDLQRHFGRPLPRERRPRAPGPARAGPRPAAGSVARRTSASAQSLPRCESSSRPPLPTTSGIDAACEASIGQARTPWPR